MNILLIDDDEAVRSILQDIIEDYDLGTVVGTMDSAATLDDGLLRAKHVDILIIDMLMPGIDGIKAVEIIRANFTGKVIMLSQVESKDLVGKAYAQGIDFYITKPLNRNEIVSVIRKVSEHLRLESLARRLQGVLQDTLQPAAAPSPAPKPPTTAQKGNALLQDLGIHDASGASDLLHLAGYAEPLLATGKQLPALKAMFLAIAEQAGSTDPSREAKAMEQRLRRTIYQAMLNIAALGAMDYANPRFEELAPRYFDYAEMQNLVHQLEQENRPTMGQVHINTKRFVHAFCHAVLREDG